MASLLEDLVTFIVAQGGATGDNVDIFRDYSPDSPDSAVILYEYAGIGGQKGSEAGFRSVQVVARDEQPTNARTKADQLFAILNRIDENITYLTPSRWAILNPKQSPFKLGVDDSNRILYGFNMMVTTNYNT